MHLSELQQLMISHLEQQIFFFLNVSVFIDALTHNDVSFHKNKTKHNVHCDGSRLKQVSSP